jgi:putative tryptophan/tyrosine transport system substrate-binding protein
MKRREFMAMLGGAAAGWVFAARAQQASMPVIGFLNSASPGPYAPNVAAFRNGLSELGFAEGRNVAIEYRWAEGRYDRLPEMADELVRRHVAVIVAGGDRAALAAKAATATIPIVFTVGIDPVAAGIVPSLGRPGGNLTGVSILNSELTPKRLELLHELMPTVSTVALLINPRGSGDETVKDVQSAAESLRLRLHVLHASTEAEIDAAFATLMQIGACAFVIGPDPFFNARTEQLAALSLHYGIPAVYQFREFAAAGGLMSYGTDSLKEAYHLAAVYAGRILRGEKPGDLPVQQATKGELVINLKTAKALGLTVPLSLIARADEVIE